MQGLLAETYMTFIMNTKFAKVDIFKNMKLYVGTCFVSKVVSET